jgi:hypothetical protein
MNRPHGRHLVSGLIFLLASCVLLLAPAAAEAASSGGNTQQAARAQFTLEHSAAAILDSKRGIKRVYGTAFEHGNSPEDAAQRFINARSRMFGVRPDELRANSRAGRLQHTQPLMYDRQSGRYRFTLVTYSQLKQELPVFRSDLRLLVRNEPDSPLVLAASSLRDLGAYSIAESLRSDLARPAFLDGRFEAARKAALARVPTLRNFGDPEVVVWAGVNDETPEPAVALQFIADNHGASTSGRPEAWLFLADVQTGEILYAEYLIRRTDVTGSVSALSTTGSGADICESEVAGPMPYARVNIGSTEVYADSNGAFTIPNAGSTAVIVESPVRGQYFVVTNQLGAYSILSANVTPPGPADFLHNADNISESIRAYVNGYVDSNVVRDAIVNVNPAYPGISSQSEFPVFVNRNDGYCPGNAWYDPTLVTLNFCSAGASYPNTAWSSVIYHEYGHHLVATGGSGQGEYGEGMGDVISAIILDDHRLGLGFYGSCSSWLRDADNTLQYPCDGEIHYCGQLLSGSVWDTRNALASSMTPAEYQPLLMALAVNSVLLHSGTSITPAISTDWLTLDDDNGDLSDGTPHSVEIETGFGAHNMIPPPPPVNDACTDAIPICPGVPQSGSTISAMSDGASSCGSSGISPDAWYSYTPVTSGSATFSLCNSGTTYDSVLSVHTSCPGSSANDIGCDDDACAAGGASEVTLNVVAGETYLIRVTGWNGSVGDFELNVSGPSCSTGCTIDADCDDGDACNGSETCVGNACQPGTPLSCDDSNACTTDSCAGGVCYHDPLFCDDADSCTADSCDNGACVNDPIAGCCGNLVCESGEDCDTCATDCVGQAGVEPGCGNGYCEPGLEDCLSCPEDCRGRQNGNPGNRYCCGDGGGENPVGCEDSRCSSGGFQCSDILPGGYCCGDSYCDPGEDSSNCALDCGTCVPTVEDCANGVDDDCDGQADCNDSDCAGSPACSSTPSCSDIGVSCNTDNECCSRKCRGRTGAKICR